MSSWTRYSTRERSKSFCSPATTGSSRASSRAKIRESYEQALELAREARPRGERRARWSRSGSPISSGSQENLLHPLRLQPDVVRRGGRAGRLVRRREAAAAARARARARVVVERVDEDARPPAGRTRAGRRRASRRRSCPHAIASRIDWPNGSISAGAQTTSAAASQPGTSSCGTRPTTRTPLAPLELRARSGPSPTNVRLPRPSVANASASRTHVLALGQRADVQRTRARSSSARRLADGEPLEVDARVDHHRLAARLGDLQLELAAQVLRDGDHRRRRARRRARVSAATPGDRADVADVAAVRGDDERRVDLGRDQPRRDEEVRPDDVGPRRRAHLPAQLEVARACRRRGGRAPRSSISCPRSRSACSSCATNDAEVRDRPAPGTSARRAGSAPHGCQRARSYSPHSSRSTPQISPIVQRARSASRIGSSMFSRRRARPRAPRRSAAAASAALRSARTRAVRSSWRRSAAGSMPLQLDRLAPRRRRTR